MLFPGLYEQVINTALNRELSEIPDARKSVAPIDKAEASKVLAQYLADVVQKGLENVLDNGGDISDQMALPTRLSASSRTQPKKLTLPRWALTSGQSSFLRFYGSRTHGWRWAKLLPT